MPAWVQIILTVAAGLTAIGVIWKKLVRPLASMIALGEQMMPLMVKLTEVFKGDPNALSVLNDIAAQFRTDSGSSLRDVVNRIDKAAEANHAAAEVLKVGVEAAKQLAERDRAQMQRLEIYLDRLGVKVDAGSATGMRIEKHASGVAEDLAAAHKRADEVSSGDAGSAADAAAQQTIKEKRQEQ
jgi:hypothetical protein